MSALKILHVCGSLDRGGIQQMVLLQAKGLIDKGHAVDICTMSDREGELAGAAREFGARVLATTTPRNVLRFRAKFNQILADGHYDVVHVQRSSHFSAFPIMLAKRYGVPCRIANYHNHSKLRTRSLLEIVLRRIVLRDSTWILGVSKTVLESQFGAGWEKDDRFVLLPNAIDISRFRSSRNRDETRRMLGLDGDTPVLGHCSRFSKAKNQEFLLEIFPEIRKRHLGTKLVLAGEGPMFQEVRERALAMGLEGDVLFPGWKDEFRYTMYSALDVFLFPSLWEGFGIVLLEAQASGVPCIASTLDCFEGVLSPENSVLKTSLEQPEMWVKRAVDLLNDKSLREKISHDGIHHVEKFDIPNHIDRLLCLYGEARD